MMDEYFEGNMYIDPECALNRELFTAFAFGFELCQIKEFVGMSHQCFSFPVNVSTSAIPPTASFVTSRSWISSHRELFCYLPSLFLTPLYLFRFLIHTSLKLLLNLLTSNLQQSLDPLVALLCPCTYKSSNSSQRCCVVAIFSLSLLNGSCQSVTEDSFISCISSLCFYGSAIAYRCFLSRT